MKRERDETAPEGANGASLSKRRLLSLEETHKYFREDLFLDTIQNEYTSNYSTSKPYLHGVIRDLIAPSLLRNVRTEIQANISFTPKETDIYKIYQSGDLANLDGLDDVSLKQLPSLVTLRDALYSGAFRKYLAAITGSGPLSGKKTDMAVNVYTPGCHLLCHDDVIGSRRISYILYLTDPEYPWQAKWGGALRLYPTNSVTMDDGKTIKSPSPEFSVQIPPAFNQLSFFAVQPGQSFHDVEEVYERQSDEDEQDGGRVRMAISGWYHIPQEGEDGYEDGAEERQIEKSSLAQLEGSADQVDLPQPRWVSHQQQVGEQNIDDVDLDEQDLNFLIQYINPRYLTPDTVEELAETFSEESSLRLGLFLSEKYSTALRDYLLEADVKQTATANWVTARPPHKHRYLFYQKLINSRKEDTASEGTSPLLLKLVDDLFPSLAFKKWLSLVTQLSLDNCNIVARRFRKGMDYTLATSYQERDPQLELCLGITPSSGWGEEGLAGGDDENLEDVFGEASAAAAVSASSNGQAEAKPSDTSGGVGGYEMYMAGDEDDESEAGEDRGHGVTIPSSHTGAGKRRERPDPAVYRSGGDDDGILFTMPACFNTLSIVLRDSGVLRFVKYVSKSAKGDRWDITGEWQVESESDEEDGAEGSEVATEEDGDA